VDGAQQVSIHGEKIAVRAQVHTLSGFSAHAGQTDLLKWFSVIAPCKPRVVLTHGENGPRSELAKLIWQKHRIRPVMPRMSETIEL
jgi:metallo-beta-lactamase family protein